MDTTTVHNLNAMTGAFYRRHAQSFSQTRQDGWPGWQRVAASIDGLASGCAEGEPLNVLDVASGNGRFEIYLANSLPQRSFGFFTADNCDGLVAESRAGTQAHRRLDVVEALADDRLLETLRVPACHVAVCFGFFHHVPGSALRVRLLGNLLDAVKPGGMVAVSLWRFMDDAAQAAKVQRGRKAAERAARAFGVDASRLEPGDQLLGWQGDFTVPRYCHSFCDADIDQMLDAMDGRIASVQRYRADGRTGTMNEYLLMLS